MTRKVKVGADGIGRWEETVRLVASFESAGTQPAVISYSLALRAFQKARRWKCALDEVSSFVQRLGRPDSIMYCTLMSACRWRQTLALMQQQQEHGIRADMVTYSVAASGMSWAQACALCDEFTGEFPLRVAGQWHFAEHLLAAGLELDVTAHAAALAKKGRWEWVAFYAQSLRGQVAYNVAISAMEKSSQWLPAVLLLRQLPQFTLQADAFALTGALKACAESGQWRRDLSLISSESKLDSVPRSAVLDACERCQQWQLAAFLLMQLKQSSICADVMHYNAAISAAGNCQQWQYPRTLLSELIRSSVEADAAVRSGAFVACGKGGLWQQALATVSGIDWADRSSNELLMACATAWRWQRAVALARFQAPGIQDVVTHSTLALACLRSHAGFWAVSSLRALAAEAELYFGVLKIAKGRRLKGAFAVRVVPTFGVAEAPGHCEC